MNRKLEYSLIALKHLLNKRPGELTSAKELAECYGCSFDTMARVLQKLSQKHWLQSSHGATGGYLLIRDLTKVSFYDLSEIILGPIKIVRCLTSNCKIKKSCNIVSPVQTLNYHLIEVYKNLPLQKLLLDQLKIAEQSNKISFNSITRKTTQTNNKTSKVTQRESSL